MPFRVSCGPGVGRTFIVSHSAREALDLYRKLKEEDAENIEIGHLEKGLLSVPELEALAKNEPAAVPPR